jgi:nitroimidazol reductase NimA-like FMN-containing flavoprotein (pyridoxamine 5'-phosphate oxidase superfamily)/GNAT superfamily N-acetyltransferase
MIRVYTPADTEQLVELFTQTVHIVSSCYYSPEEIKAWAPLHCDTTAWLQFFDRRYTIVMDSDAGITGFGCLGANGATVDMLFTHHAHQNEGIGSAMLDFLEKEAMRRGKEEIMLTTSATAWSFYQKRGYQYRHSEIKTYGAMVFDCQVLCKALPVFRNIRRKDRALDDEKTMQLLETGEYGFLAICGKNGYGYGVPLNYVLHGKSIYFHCAPEGFKLDHIRQNNRVSFCVVGRTKPLPERFSTAYESAMVFGRIAHHLSEAERYRALDLIVAKYSPDFVEISKKYIGKSFHRTHILRLDIEFLSGKTNFFSRQTHEIII